MKIEIELGHPEVPSRDASIVLVEALKYTAAGIRVAYAKGYIRPPDYADLIADALDGEARRIEGLLADADKMMTHGSGEANEKLKRWLAGGMPDGWFLEAVRKNPDADYVTPYGTRRGRVLLGLMGVDNE